MKKIFMLCLLLVFVVSLFADLMEQVEKNAAYDNVHKTAKVYSGSSREVPEWSFEIDPVSLITSYYDYMPGSYNSTPVRIQPDEAGGGIYITFHSRETAASTRRIYYAYIDADGNVTNVATISTDDIHEGYAGLDVDPLTGNPIVAWHANVETASADNECVVSYDLFHLGSPGLWKTPFVVIDESYISNDPADEFEWPYIFIGPSPVADKQRVYIVANNAYGPTGSASENVLIGWSDFDVNDFNSQSELDWSYYTIPLMDEWNQGIPEWIRPFKAMAVSDDGKVALIGFTATDGETTTIGDKLFCFLNDNYGEGDYEYFETTAEWSIDNPQNQDGTYRFLDENGAPHNLYMEPYLSGHQNAIFTDGDTKLKFPGAMNMTTHPASWFPDLPMLYPKMFTFDLDTEVFSFQDMYIPGEVYNDNIPMLPWDLNEDGVVDEFDPDGYVTWVEGWPIYHFDNAVAFHENNFKMTKNEDNGWLAVVWSEGLKSRLGNIPEPGYEDWAEYPEVCVTISNDFGETWMDPILFNAKVGDGNYVAQLDGMIPCYVYVGDEIEDLGGGHGLLHLFFYDDNSYGSSIQGHGENLGGTLMYSALDIAFETVGADPTITPAAVNLYQNYPNPFNPTTTIAYGLQEAGNVELEVYNVKGQKVKTLISEYQEAGHHTIQWNGEDAYGKTVSTGVYFYKIRSGGKYTSTRKMIMLK
jgi:FlgD Ig-like domain